MPEMSLNMLHHFLKFLQISNNFFETHEILPVYVNNDDKLLLEEDHSLIPEKKMKNIKKPCHSTA
jgi:hypothetical protein